MLAANSQSPFNQAVQLHRAGRFPEAIAAYQALLRGRSINKEMTAQIESMLGAALDSVGRSREGREHILKAIKLAPCVARYHRELSKTYRREGKFGPARDAIAKAIALDPADPTLRASLSELHHLQGDYEAAMRALSPVLAKASSYAAVAIVFGTLAPRVGRQEEAIQALRQAIAQADMPPVQRMKALFTLGALYDGVDRFEEAFETFRRANALSPLRYDASQHEAATDAVIARWSREAIAGLPSAAPREPMRTLLIVGMPRSGTTLVEQILSVSPEVLAAGELNDFPRLARAAPGCTVGGFPIIASPERLTPRAIEDVRRGYADALRALKPQGRLVIDKLPLNFLNLGLLQQAVPEAKVIHCRRDPLDTCLSCYFHLFDGALGFAYSLEGLGHFHRQYQRLMAHWRSVLALPILDVDYEELVADQEGVSRRIWEFAGLPWTDEALRFHESRRTSLSSSNAQVRQPIYTRSVQRNRNYDRWLGPLRTALGATEGRPPGA